MGRRGNLGGREIVLGDGLKRRGQLRLLLDAVGRAKWGLVAQVVTTVTTFLPIAFGLSDALVFLVQASAISSVMIGFATAGAQVFLPGLEDSASLAREVRIELSCLVTHAGLLIGFGALVGATSLMPEHLVLLFELAGVLLFSQGLFVIGAGLCVRLGDYATLMRMRLVYAGLGGVATLVLCLNGSDGPSFVMATGLAFIVGCGALILAQRLVVGDLLLRHRRGRQVVGGVPSLRARRDLLVGYLFAGLGTQLPAMLLPALGPLAAPWAVVVRVSSGVQTAALTFVAPAVDMDLGRAMRSDDQELGARTVRSGLRTGLSLAFLTTAVSVLALLFIDVASVTPRQWLAFIVALLGFAGAGTVIGPVTRSLAMLGGLRNQLWWNMARAVAAAACLLLLPAAAALMGLGLVGVVSTLWYVRATNRRIGGWKRVARVA